jgi:hypothetical protein
VLDSLHYIRNGDGVEELYHLGRDSRETVNLATIPQYASGAGEASRCAGRAGGPTLVGPTGGTFKPPSQSPARRHAPAQVVIGLAFLPVSPWARPPVAGPQRRLRHAPGARSRTTTTGARCTCRR